MGEYRASVISRARTAGSWKESPAQKVQFPPGFKRGISFTCFKPAALLLEEECNPGKMLSPQNYLDGRESRNIHSPTFPLISSEKTLAASVAVVLAPNPAWLTLDFILVLPSRSSKQEEVSVFRGS
jgi:hypothetical protein